MAAKCFNFGFFFVSFFFRYVIRKMRITMLKLKLRPNRWAPCIRMDRNLPLDILWCRRACGFQNLVGTWVYGGHNLPPLVGIGLRWLPKLGVDTSPRPHAHRRARLISFQFLTTYRIKSIKLEGMLADFLLWLSIWKIQSNHYDNNNKKYKK